MKRFSLTTRGFLLLVALTILLVAALWSGTQYELMWRVFAVFVGAIFVVEWLGHRSTRVELNVSGDFELRLGEPANLKIEIASSNGMLSQAYLPGAETFEVRRQNLLENGLYCVVVPVRLGDLDLGALHVRTEGLFRLSGWDHEVAIPQAFRVKPSGQVGGMALNSEHLDQKNPDNVSGQGFELDRLRDYQPGDSVRYIDWKATAKRRKKTVRLFTDDNQQEICILLDASHYGRIEVDGLSRLTHMLNSTAKLSHLALASGDQVSFCAYGVNAKAMVAPGKGYSQHQKILNSLEHITLDEGPANHLMGYMQASRHLKRRSMLVFVTHLDHASQTDHLLQTVALASRKHLVVTVSLLDVDLQALITAKPSRWREPFQALAASQVKESTDTLVGELRRRGTHVLHSRVEQVDRDLIATYQRIRNRRLVS